MANILQKIKGLRYSQSDNNHKFLCKASEWRNWLLLYAVVSCLNDILQDGQ